MSRNGAEDDVDAVSFVSSAWRYMYINRIQLAKLGLLLTETLSIYLKVSGSCRGDSGKTLTPVKLLTLIINQII
jgi:hypothetical protein